MKANYDNSISFQVRDLEGLAPIQADLCFNEAKLQACLDPEVAKNLKRVIFVGCGDSYSAAGAMLLGFTKMSGIIKCAAPDIMDFDYYYEERDVLKGCAPSEVMLVAISASGGSKSVVDALTKANEMGAHTLLITRTPDSISGHAAKMNYNVETPEGCNTPGLRSYYASMVGILALGAYIGMCKGKTTKEEWNQLKEDIVSTTLNFMKEYDRIDDQMFEIAKKWKDLRKFEITADWNETYSAQFVEQKIYETSGSFATHTNSEEWCHIGCMMRNPMEIGSIFMINEENRTLGRMVDTIYEAYVLERPTLIVSDADASVFAEFEEADVCLIPKAAKEWLSPLVDYIPGSLLAGYHSALNELWFFGGRYDFRKQEWHRD